MNIKTLLVGMAITVPMLIAGCGGGNTVIEISTAPLRVWKSICPQRLPQPSRAAVSVRALIGVALRSARAELSLRHIRIAARQLSTWRRERRVLW